MTIEKPENSLKLKVSGALGKDVNHGYARLAPEDLALLKADLGDIVEVVGRSRTVVKAMPAYKERREQSWIQLDGITRENAGAGLDESVLVRRISCRPAERVMLVSRNLAPSEQDLAYIGTRLNGLPILAENSIRATLFGAHWAEFKVTSTVPEGPVLISPATQFALSKDTLPEEFTARTVSYEDIGGLKRELQRIREMIELPLRYPEVFERLGLEASGGLLLHGPAGCGKKLIARALAHETQAHFFPLSGPEIIQWFYGGNDTLLRKTFEDAIHQAPALIFLGEIDAIAPRREQWRGEVEKRIVAQLSALMDRLAQREKVMVLAATNFPQVLDPAMRRPGRFEREIAIPLPDRYGRQEILEIHSRGMALAASVNLNHLAEITHGLVGADLEEVCRQAALISLRRIMPDMDFSLASIPYDRLAKLEVEMDDFLETLRNVESVALRDAFGGVRNPRWSEAGNPPDFRQIQRLTKTTGLPPADSGAAGWHRQERRVI